MYHLRPGRPLFAALLLLLLLFSASFRAGAGALTQPLPPAERRAGQTLERDARTGVPSFLAGDLPAIKARVSTPLAAARAFFAENPGLFRMRNPAAELALQRQQRDQLGMEHLRFQQLYNGVEVFGGVLVAHTRGTRISAISGSYFPDINLDTTPRLSFEQALAQARLSVGQLDAEVVRARSGLAIYARDGHATLSWKLELRVGLGAERWLVFIDAQDGTRVHMITMTAHARSRSTHTLGTNTSPLPGTLLCNEASPSGCDGDPVAKAAHDNAGDVYDYYLARFGRDSIDGAGMEIVSTVHYGLEYNNAFWSGEQMVYGDGDGVLFDPLSLSMDIVGHELTHGVIQHTANLVYEDESGALNESYADVFGVFAEAFSRGSTVVDWDVGEDAWTPNVAGDGLRDMQDPNKGNDAFTLASGCLYRVGQPFYCGQPAHMDEIAHLPVNYFETVPSDNGGVHINSGIPNKAAYLLTNGGTFGGVTVAGIGVLKAEQISYRALAYYLTPYSSFMNARYGSIQACEDLIGQFSISAGDCDSVRDAFAAVGLGHAANVTLRQLYLPLVRSALTPAIRGQVLRNNVPAAGVRMYLQSCDDRNNPVCAATARQAVSDSSGVYAFPAATIPSTNDHTWYRVRYISPSDQPDGTMIAWYGDDIGTYAQGTNLQVDPIDIGDVTYISPNSTTPLSLASPITFLWNQRNVAEPEYYYWELLDVDFEVIAEEYSFLMHTTPSFTLNGEDDPEITGEFAGARYWDALVISASGWGISWNAGVVRFQGVPDAQPDTRDLALRKEKLLQRLDGQRSPFGAGSR